MRRAMGNRIGAWVRRLATDDDQLQAAELSSGVVADGSRPTGSCTAGERVMILGRLRCVDLQPADSLATLTAELWDGTDAVQLIWLGRRTIPGVEAGRTVRAHGRLAMRDGRKVMYNPQYELLPAHT